MATTLGWGATWCTAKAAIIEPPTAWCSDHGTVAHVIDDLEGGLGEGLLAQASAQGRPLESLHLDGDLGDTALTGIAQDRAPFDLAGLHRQVDPRDPRQARIGPLAIQAWEARQAKGHRTQDVGQMGRREAKAAAPGRAHRTQRSLDIRVVDLDHAPGLHLTGADHRAPDRLIARLILRWIVRLPVPPRARLRPESADQVPQVLAGLRRAHAQPVVPAGSNGSLPPCHA
jgi:hypothetical protein